MATRYSHLFRDHPLDASGAEALEGDLTASFDEEEGQELSVEAGAGGTWTLRLKPGVEIREGDVIAFARELPSVGFEGFRLALRPQTFNPKGLDYVTASTEAPVEYDIVSNRLNIKGREIAFLEVKRGKIPRGERIELRVGDRTEGGRGSFVWPVARMDAWILAYLKRNDAPSYTPFAPRVHVSVRPSRRAKQLQVVAPSDVVSGEPFTLRVVVRDLNANVLQGYEGRLMVETVGEEAQPLRIEASSSILKLPVTLEGPGVRWLRVEASGISQLSNPLRVHEAQPAMRTYWGDIHAHCYDAWEIKVLDETTDPRAVLATGRDENMIDVCAVSPHVFPDALEAMDKWWALLNRATRDLNSEEFVTFPCFEYRGQGGDRNLLFREEHPNPPHLDQTLEPIWALSPREVAVLPHVGGGTSDWSLHKPILEPSAEVASAHGNFEWFLQEGLSRGAVVGIHASSDGHNRTAGHPRHMVMGGGRFGDLNRRDCQYGGASLAAFNSPTLDRESIWRALRSRNTYGCTDARMLISLSIEGRRMGSTLSAERRPRIDAWAAGTAIVQRLEIIRDDRLLHTHRGRSLIERTSCVDQSIPQGRHYYYLRATQRNGEIAWSSPIWVTYEGPKGRAAKLPRWNRQELLRRRKPPPGAPAQLSSLRAYLRREEERRFRNLRWVDEIRSPQGHYHCFVGYDDRTGVPIHIKWYTSFPDERLRVDTGWRDYGQFRVPRR